MKIVELPTGDWVDPGTVEKVYQTTRSVPQTIHVVVVQCFGRTDLSYEYPSLDACRENCARIGRIIREAQDGECKLTVDNQPAPQLPCLPVNASPIIKVVLPTGVVVHGPSGAVLRWLAHQTEHRPQESLPAVVVHSPVRTAEEAHALGEQWASVAGIAVVS